MEETGFHGYPDVLVVCGEPRFPEDDGHSLLNPVLVVEVLSPTTERHERVFKLDQYRRIPSLRQVLLVSQDEPRVESYSPVETGWLLEVAADLESTLRLAAVEAELRLADVYDGIDFTPSETASDPGARSFLAFS